MVPVKYQLCNFRPFEIRWWPQCSSKTKNSFLYTPEYICVRCWQKRSGEIGTTKNPSTKMSISLNSYASLSYWSCCSKCVLKKTASMVAWSMSTVAPFSNRSDDIEMTKSPSIKMNTSCNIYVNYIYKSYGSKCLLKQTASLVVWSMSTWQLFKLDPTILKWPRILGPRWAYPSIFTQAELIDHVVRTGVRNVYEEQNGHSIFT